MKKVKNFTQSIIIKKNQNFTVIKTTKNYIMKKNQNFIIINITSLKKIKIITS